MTEFKLPAGAPKRTGVTKPPGGAKVKNSARARHKRGEMNDTELAYSKVLEARRIAGEIRAWEFERITFTLAYRSTYTPDFAVWMADGTLEVHETKGWMEDDAAKTLRFFVERFPHVRLILVRREGGEWTYEER